MYYLHKFCQKTLKTEENDSKLFFNNVCKFKSFLNVFSIYWSFYTIFAVFVAMIR